MNQYKDTLDKRIHDDHRLLGHSSVRVHLFEHLVDVGGVGRVVGLAFV